MNQRIANKKLKKSFLLGVMWMYHYMSDQHIVGHKWLHNYQYRMINKTANKIKFRQILESKHYKKLSIINYETEYK